MIWPQENKTWEVDTLTKSFRIPQTSYVYVMMRLPLFETWQAREWRWIDPLTNIARRVQL